MELVADIAVKKVALSSVGAVDFDKLEFGKYVSDHMVTCDFSGKHWGAPYIVPYADISLSPAALALHYGQTVFEGMKAFRMTDGTINVFRMDKHYERFCRSLERMCMPPVTKDIFEQGIAQLIALDKAWVPAKKGDALYIRPFMFASEARFGVKVSDEYKFLVFTGPVPSLYAEPIKVKVEMNYVRAARGGTGFAKCGGNYGAAFLPTQLARQEGYDQVLWTDARENKFIEESGMMNVMFVINNVLVTPSLSDSILDGVTRDSLLTLAGDLGYHTEERPVSVAELKTAFESGTITEAFGAGTAAVVAPIRIINIRGTEYALPKYGAESLLNTLKTKLELIRTGEMPDIHGWNYIL